MSRISKIIDSKRGKAQKFTSPPLFIPATMRTPETANQTMARLMLNSGVISRDDYEKMLGVRYDCANDDEATSFDDDFSDDSYNMKQSQFAEYEDFEQYVANSEKQDLKSLNNDLNAKLEQTEAKPTEETKNEQTQENTRDTHSE